MVEGGPCDVVKERNQTFPSVEESQADLRMSIERARALSAESDRSIRRNREGIPPRLRS